MGLIKKNGQSLTEIGEYVYGRWKKEVPLGFEGA